MVWGRKRAPSISARSEPGAKGESFGMRKAAINSSGVTARFSAGETVDLLLQLLRILRLTDERKLHCVGIDLIRKQSFNGKAVIADSVKRRIIHLEALNALFRDITNPCRLKSQLLCTLCVGKCTILIRKGCTHIRYDLAAVDIIERSDHAFQLFI